MSNPSFSIYLSLYISNLFLYLSIYTSTCLIPCPLSIYIIVPLNGSSLSALCLLYVQSLLQSISIHLLMHPVYTSISLYLNSISFHYILCTSSLFLPCRIPNDRPESICIYVCFRWHLRNRCLFLCFTYPFSPVAVFALYSFLCSSLRTFYLSW